MNNSSYWVDSTKTTHYPTLTEDIKTEVCIVGGGLVAAITGYLLTNEGIDVTIVEKDKVCMGVTANSTAKLTSQHGLLYQYLTNNFSFEFAKDYLDSNEDAVHLAEKIIKKENIACDFEKQDAYVFTTSQEEVPKIEDEVKIVNKLGLNAQYCTNIPLPLNNILAAIKFPNQAQFHVRKYALSLFNIISKNHGKIFENTKVIDIEKNTSGYTIFSETNKISSKYVIIATHYPIINFPGFYFLKMYQDKSYIIALDTKEELFPRYVY